MVSCMTRLMEASRRTYQAFDGTFRGSYPEVFERHTRRRTDDKSWLVQDQTVPVQKQTAFGKDKSNPLIVDSLLKTIRLSIHLVVYNEELAIPEQTATEGKLKENQGCRVDTDQVHQNGDLKNRSVWIHPPGLQDVYTKET
ncbi:hypothetical protein Tco_1403885 [Tanacetum coccineum]